jgi:Ca2+-binding RTX toxin-like protein
LNGGTGNDRIRTGSGADRIVYRSAKEGVDTILDFNVAMDVIDLRRIFNRPEYTSANPFRDYVRLSNGADGAILRVDADGGAAGGFVRLAVLQGVEVSSLNRATNFRL